MNTMRHFKEMEDDEQRKDIHEGSDRIEQIMYLEIIWEGKTIELSRGTHKNTLSSAQLRSVDANLGGNIFCMIAITPELLENTASVDERNMEFGDSFLVILNPNEFLSRAKKSLTQLEKTFHWGLVTYYDEETLNGDLDVFSKPSKYSHQSEFRIFVESEGKEPFILPIGSIEDISEIFEIGYLKRL